MKNVLLVMMLVVSIFTQAKTADVIVDHTADGVSTVYSDGKQVVKTAYEEIKNVSPQVKEAFQSLASEMKVTTDYLWDVLVKQQKVYSVALLALTLGSLFNWWLLWYRNFSTTANNKTVKKLLPSDKRNPDYETYPNVVNDINKYKSLLEVKEIPYLDTDKAKAILFIHSILCIILSSFSAYYLSTMLTGFMNPEFGALKAITEVVKSLK